MNLKQRVAEARAARDAVRNRLEGARAAVAETDRSAAEHEADTLRQELAEREKAFNERQKAIARFPTETQLLKLERRLETLKTQLSEAQDVTKKTKTAMDAYGVHFTAASSSRSSLAEVLRTATQKSLEGINAKVMEEDALPSTEHVLRACDELNTICDEREGALLQLNQQYTERLQELQQINDRIVAQQQRFEADLPQLEAEAERYIRAITAAWTNEKEALQATYDRLYAVNKEQAHHLGRGTHVKRDTRVNAGHEAALSARHNNLSAQLIDARARLQELQADNAFTKKITDQLSAEGRLSLIQYSEQKTEVEARLKAARSERFAAEDEARKFRNLKSDLQHALHTIRDTHGSAAKLY